MATMNIGWKKRPAKYFPNKYQAFRMGIPEGTMLNVDVLGLYQVNMDEDVDAYFIVEDDVGKCWYAGVEEIQFTDKEERGNAENSD